MSDRIDSLPKHSSFGAQLFAVSGNGPVSKADLFDVAELAQWIEQAFAYPSAYGLHCCELSVLTADEDASVMILALSLTDEEDKRLAASFDEAAERKQWATGAARWIHDATRRWAHAYVVEGTIAFHVAAGRGSSPLKADDWRAVFPLLVTVSEPAKKGSRK